MDQGSWSVRQATAEDIEFLTDMLLAAVNWSLITSPIIGDRPPPSRVLIAYMPMAGTNTSSTPAVIPGAVSGSTTRDRVRTGPAPRSSDASIRVPSSFSTDP